MQGDAANKCVFVKGSDADSAECALQKLLEVTMLMLMLKKERKSNIFRTNDATWVAEGPGGYYQ